MLNEGVPSDTENNTVNGGTEYPGLPLEETEQKQKTARTVYYEPWNEAAFSRPEDISDYYSPNYHSTASAYSYSPAQKTSVREKRNKEKHSGKGKRILGSICLILACGAFSGLCAAVVTNNKLAEAPPASKTEVILGAAAEKADTVPDTAEETTAAPAAGAELEPGQIYALACEQAVGIQVTVSGRNVFGQLVTGTPVSGSGFIVSQDGYVVTNYHVIESVLSPGRSSEIVIQMYDGGAYAAEVIGYEEEDDLAVLKLEANGLKPVTLGSISESAVGDTVYVVGNPLGELTYTMTDGMICAMDRVISTEVSTAINVFQINAAVNSGNSGGPVYNSRGEVIGIVDAKYRATGVEGLGFAIPIDDAVPVIQDLIENGYVTGKAYMGIYAKTVSGMEAAYYNLEEGAFIDAMERGGCAERAGLKPGDIITGVADNELKTAEDLRKAVKTFSAGDTAELKVFRGGETISLYITFDEQPATVQKYNGTSLF